MVFRRQPPPNEMCQLRRNISLGRHSPHILRYFPKVRKLEFSEVHCWDAKRRRVRRVMSSPCSQPSPMKETSSSKRKSPSEPSSLSPCSVMSALSLVKANTSRRWGRGPQPAHHCSDQCVFDPPQYIPRRFRVLRSERLLSFDPAGVDELPAVECPEWIKPRRL